MVFFPSRFSGGKKCSNLYIKYHISNDGQRKDSFTQFTPNIFFHKLSKHFNSRSIYLFIIIIFFFLTHIGYIYYISFSLNSSETHWNQLKLFNVIGPDEIETLQNVSKNFNAYLERVTELLNLQLAERVRLATWARSES